MGGIGEEQLKDFNRSLLFFLPKKPSGSAANGESIFEAANVRPLNVTNSDNRLIASAIRGLIEPIVGPRIMEVQRGFVGGRSMIANLLDVDCAMISGAFESDDAAALFFDFAAASPSVEQDFMMRVFEKLGWPRWLLNVVSVLYEFNICVIVMGGMRHDGFAITRGVRQGCPLSPLLFAVASDALLRRILRLVPGGVVRAYADDTALIHHHIWDHLPVVEGIFADFSEIAGGCG